MALKDTWVDKIDGVDINSADDINQVAHAVIELEENGIIDTATGEVLALTDSAEAPLSGLVVYGKSTQDGTPTPDSPVPIVSVGEDGVTDVGVYGANLFNPSDVVNQTFGKVTVSGDTITINGQYYAEFGVKLRAGKSYTINYTETHTQSAMARVRYYDNSLLDVDKGIPFTPTKDVIGLYLYAGMGTVGETVYSYVMLNAGETALPYEPYKPAQTLPVSTPDGLCGIPVTSGGNYTDASGQQWVCDEIDFVRGVRVQRVGEGYITNKSNIGIDNTEKYPGRRYVRLSTPSIAIESAIMSDSLTYNHYNSSLIGLAVENAGISLSATKNDVLYFNIAYMQSEDTVEATKEVLAQYTLKYVYAIKTPIETPLTEEELAAYRALQTNYPNTTIYADDNAGLSVGYSADTKLYIDKKFAELAAEIVNN